LGSLRQFGQRKPIVVTADSVVVGGNGTLTAERLLDWTKLDVVRIPSDWTEDKIMAFALADNRTAELATWDSEILAEQLLELQDFGFLIEEIGFVQEQPKEIDDSTEAMDWEEKYEVVVNCENEFQQQELLTRLSKEGYQVKAMLL